MGISAVLCILYRIPGLNIVSLITTDVISNESEKVSLPPLVLCEKTNRIFQFVTNVSMLLYTDMILDSFISIYLTFLQ